MKYIGLGDWLAMVLKRLGIKQGKNCNCPHRQAQLNRYWPNFKVLN